MQVLKLAVKAKAIWNLQWKWPEKNAL